MIKTYRKLPVVIKAMQLFTENKEEIIKWSTTQRPIVIVTTEPDNKCEIIIKYAEIHTLEGTMKAQRGDYIIKGINGEVYPCKPDIFKKTYEEVT